MIANCFSTVAGVLVVLAALGAPATAAEAMFNAELLVCNSCHGERGVPKDATIPIIWGQQENFLLKQLRDFQSGDRNVEVMSWMTNSLSPAELGLAAAYFAKKSWPPQAPGAPSPPLPAGAAVCQICHQQNFVGGLPAPRLAGQSYEYLIEAMRRYADGERTNNSDMVNLMKTISPAEREAMARYMSGL
jgi:cytochrome c553